MTAKKYKYIPSDVLPNILSRLPVKSLKRFECVSKFWYDLIKDPNFALEHLHHNKNVNRHCLLQKGIRTTRLLCLDEITQHVSRHRLNLPSVFYEILGPCNGIYCFIRFNYEFKLDLIALANVSLREFMFVPDLSITSPHGQHQCVGLCGFGFDRKTNDYKLVLILSYTDRMTGINLYHKEVVYSLRSKSWRELEHTFFPYDRIRSWHYPQSDSGTYVNGNSHWLMSETAHGLAIDDLRHTILYFDMADEVFRLIWLPKLRDFAPDSDIYVRIHVVYNDSLTVAAHPMYYLPDKTCEVWILLDYCNEKSWIKLVTIGPIEGIARSLKLLGFWRNGEFLFEYDQEKVISYNPNTQKITKKLRVCGPLRAYSESLVSIIGDQRDNQNMLFIDQRDNQNMLFDIVKESDDITLQQTTSS